MSEIRKKEGKYERERERLKSYIIVQVWTLVCVCLSKLVCACMKW